MNGVLIGGCYIPLALTNRLDPLLEGPGDEAAKSQPGKKTYDICELNVSIFHDRDRAMGFAKPYVSHLLLTLKSMGFSDDEFRTIGVEPKLVKSLKDTFENGATVQDAAKLIPDEAVGSCFVAGRPEECRDQILALMEHAELLAISQISFAKLGPDYEEAITLLREEILPG